MHFDLDCGGPETLTADYAVIGAGAAGLTLARTLLGGGARVVLLESGGLDYEAETAALNIGSNVGQDYYPLEHARLRFFGGTTAIWGGRCAELDPIDFAARDWVPHSGWPFDARTLQPFYADARAALGLPAVPAGEDDLRLAGAPLPDFDECRIRTGTWWFDTRFDRFAFAGAGDIVDHPRATVVSHATVTEIVAADDGARIERLDVAGLGGRRMHVVAGDYLLAAGGIENARLLLASRSVMPAGVGNDHDLVGRFFMEHPHARGGRIVGGAAWRLFDAYRRRGTAAGPAAPVIRPGEVLQERERLLNTSLVIAPRRPASGSESWAMRAYLHAKHEMDPTAMGRTLWRRVKSTVGWLQEHSDPLRPWLLNRLGRLDVALLVRAEQAPNPDSRVRLGRDRDALGVPRVELDWRTNALDVDSVAGLVAALGREAERLGLGRVEAAPWLADPSKAWVTDPLISTHPIGGYHHIGTTRMADDPRRGVTDGWGRVHGIANLHVAGSSLFPTSGWANPTLTIVALALRTARHLLDRPVAVVRTRAERVTTQV